MLGEQLPGGRADRFQLGIDEGVAVHHAHLFRGIVERVPEGLDGQLLVIWKGLGVSGIKFDSTK